MSSRIARWIKKNRLSHDMTQKQFADKMGVSQSQVSNWENGSSEPSQKAVQIMSSTFGQEPPVAGSEAPLAEWLKKRREQMKLSKTELAEKTGISGLAIYFIETGRTESPRLQTIRSLEAVLGKMPSGVKEDVKVERSVGELEFLGPFPMDGWEENVGDDQIACVYVLYDELKRPVRIGETGDLKRRLAEYHRDTWWCRPPTVDSFAYVIVTNQKARRNTERVMIKLVGDHAMFNIQDKL